ncbi:MAG: amidohydrolase [candidate division KSB1 bacterium]|nr:amidohydrolase [candidate division KSB1 bacterium]
MRRRKSAGTWVLMIATLIAILPGLWLIKYYRDRFVQPSEWPRIDQFHPKTLIHVRQTTILRARYPVFDTHVHLACSHLTAHELEAIMDSCGVVRVLNLEINGFWGHELKKQVSEYQDRLPGRVITACNVDFSGIGEPDFEKKVIGQLEESYRLGARAIKVWRNLGMDVRDTEGKRVPIDDPRLDCIWRKAGELGMPVIFHTADPSAYWYPVDENNERFLALQAKARPWGHKWAFPWGPLFHTVRSTLEDPPAKIRLVRHPELLYYATNIYPDPLPSKEELIRQRDNVIRRHPRTIFVGAHLGCFPEDLQWVSKELDSMPNYFVEISEAVSELGRQPYTARNFLIKYQDRVLFGTDGQPNIETYRRTFRFLETFDEYFDYPWRERFPQGEWKIYGVGLPDEVLKKIYHENAERIFGAPGLPRAGQPGT